MNEIAKVLKIRLTKNTTAWASLFTRMSRRNERTCTRDPANLYRILGLDMTEVRKLSIDDQKKTIKEAFHKKVRICHPDKNFGKNEAYILEKKELTAKIIEAKETLLDDERQARYHNKVDDERRARNHKEAERKSRRARYHNEADGESRRARYHNKANGESRRTRYHNKANGESRRARYHNEADSESRRARYHHNEANDERQYHNEADDDNGWFFSKRFKDIFWPDCDTEEQNEAYWRRVNWVAGLSGVILCGLSPALLPVVCGAVTGRAFYRLARKADAETPKR